MASSCTSLQATKATNRYVRVLRPHRKIYHAGRHVVSWCNSVRGIETISNDTASLVCEERLASDVLQGGCHKLCSEGPIHVSVLVAIREALGSLQWWEHLLKDSVLLQRYVKYRFREASFTLSERRDVLDDQLKKKNDVDANALSICVGSGAVELFAPRERRLPIPRSAWLATRWSLSPVMDRIFLTRVEEIRVHNREFDLHSSCSAQHPHFPCGTTINDMFESVAVSPLNSFEDSLAATKLIEDVRRCSIHQPQRTPEFEADNLLQEIGLCELLRTAIQNYEASFSQTARRYHQAATIQTVLDVGGGNGYLAHLVANQMPTVNVAVVDCYTPKHAVDTLIRDSPDSPLAKNCRRFLRVSKTVQSLDWTSDVSPTSSPDSSAIISKHLCGTATDGFLRLLDLAGSLPPVLVLSPCCYNKGHHWEYLNQSYLSEVLLPTEEAENQDVGRGNCRTCQEQQQETRAASFSLLTKMTDWNYSWRSAKYGKTGTRRSFHLNEEWNFLTSEVVHAALDEGRLRWLRDRGYEAWLVQYAPNVVTAKSVALIAIKRGSQYYLPK